jgi:hypothetical protein
MARAKGGQPAASKSLDDINATRYSRGSTLKYAMKSVNTARYVKHTPFLDPPRNQH